MENRKQQSSSSFTETLFGPKDSVSSSSSGHFGSVFGPPSTGLGKDSSHINYNGLSNKQDFGSPKHSTPDCKMQRSKGEKGRNPVYHSETVDQAISVHLSIMVAKKFILQLLTTLPLSEFLRKVEVMKILMEPVLQGETGGKDLSTIESQISSQYAIPRRYMPYNMG